MVRVLLFSRDASWFGGVVNFIALLKKNIDSNVSIVDFLIGQRKKSKLPLPGALVPVIDVLRLFKLLARCKFDACHINPSLNAQSLLRDGLFLLVLRLFRVRNVIVSFHGWSNDTARKIQSNVVVRKLFAYCFGYACQTLVLSEAFRQWLIEAGFEATRVQLFTTMFDDQEFDSGGDFTTRNDNSILFLSRLIREKGMYELLEAFKNLAADYPKLELVFAGNGPEEESLKKMVDESGLNDRVRFLGYVRGRDKVKAFSEAGLFVFPTSYGEGCPVSLLEAMASGLPVITTAVGGIPHIVEDGVNGFLLEDVSAGSVEKALRQLLDDPALTKSMGEQNFRDAWDKYSASAVTGMFERVYAGDRL